MNTKDRWERVLPPLAPLALFACLLATPVLAETADSGGAEHAHGHTSGRRLFERETFGGNGRTCLTCYSRKTGTVSPADAQERFLADPEAPLFRGDGSDDGNGHGVGRMLKNATVLICCPVPR